LDMGFFDAMKAIIDLCPKKRQTLLFSATYPTEIKKLCRAFMHTPTEVLIETSITEQDIEQRFYEVQQPRDKFSLLKALLLHHQTRSALIFCNTKQLTSQLAAMLVKENFSALALNGDMEQVDRDQVVVRFMNQSCSILVATDVAARGLDIKELPAVINFELAFEHDVHIHRIGRTGRAGHQGLALSLTTPADAERIVAIEDHLNHSVAWGEMDELTPTKENNLLPEMVTLRLAAGKKDKIRPGDILGALTKDAGLPGSAIGQINIAPLHAYVAIHKSYADKVYQYLQNGKLKGRKVNVRKL
jgi:ATP-independent RNA helicase DbpA